MYLRAASPYHGGIHDAVQEHGDAPAGAGKGPVTQVGEAPVSFLGLTQYERWENANVVRGRANGTVSAYAYARLGDITSDSSVSLPRSSASSASRCASRTGRTSPSAG